MAYDSLPDGRAGLHRGEATGFCPAYPPFSVFGGDSVHRALYRTWRPKTFDEVCGQEHITDILKYQVANGKISHAYLFCGSRGTGKTSSAKILAKAVNCLRPVAGNPCNDCAACRAIDAGTATDVIEMDAASNNGVDNVRDLKEEIVYMPAELKYRVYIIDEVHMMSASAFNALLKTLEEPPTYVMFILATTEFSKLPATIVSRCQRFDFRRISTEVIMERLHTIAAAEGMTLTRDGARMIARTAQGGMRDAVSLLELCGGMHTEITDELVSGLLGAGNRSTLFKTAEAIIQKDYPTIYATVDDIVMSSCDLSSFFLSLAEVFRDLIVEKTIPDAKAYLDLTDSEDERLRALSQDVPLARLYYISRQIEEVQPSLQKTGIARRASAEIALTRMCDARLGTTPEAMLSRIEELEREVKKIRMGAATASVATLATEREDVTTATDTTVSARARGASQPTPQVPRKNDEPRVAENPARGERVKGWRDIADEFLGIFPYYRSVLDGAVATTGETVLHLYLRPHILLANFERDTKAQAALLRIVSESLARSLETVCVEHLTGGTAQPTNDEELF